MIPEPLAPGSTPLIRAPAMPPPSSAHQGQHQQAGQVGGQLQAQAVHRLDLEGIDPDRHPNPQADGVHQQEQHQQPAELDEPLVGSHLHRQAHRG